MMDDVIIMNEIPYDAYKDLNETFGRKENLKMLREKFEGDSFGLADLIKMGMNARGFLAEILTFKNGHCFSDEPLKVFGHEYTYYSVVLMGGNG